MTKSNYEITILKANGGKAVAEIEDVTKTDSIHRRHFMKSGFSKMQTTQTVSVMGFPDKQDASKIMASQIIFFPISS